MVDKFIRDPVPLIMARLISHHWINWEHLYLKILKVVKGKRFISLTMIKGTGSRMNLSTIQSQKNKIWILKK